jgi:predicted permease
MSFFRGIHEVWVRLGELFSRQQRDRELAAEIESHIQMQIDDHLRAGMALREARRQALIKFGGLEQTKENCRDRRGVPWLESLLQDVRFGLRMLRKNPGFTTVAVLTLALGIGANTAIFSVVDGVLLNPLPFPDPDRVVSVHTKFTRYPRAGVSYPNFLDWRRESKSFEELAAWREDEFALSGAGHPELLNGEMVSSNFFALLRVKPVLGRFFRPDEDQLGAPLVAIISEALWKRKFGSDPNICGKSLMLNGKVYAITGVIASRLPLIQYMPNPDRQFDDVFVPIGQFDAPIFRNRQVYYGTEAIGRLKNGVTREQAGAEMDGIARELEAAYPKDNSKVRVNIMPLAEDIAGDLHPALLILWGAVSLVLLIACANVANLLLARSVVRRQELGVRIALGAGRGRIARQLLAENILLSCAGGALGVVAAGYGVRAFLRLFPSVLPSIVSIELNLRVLIFALVASFLTSILCGLVPTLGLSKLNPQQELRESGRGVLVGRHAVQRIFAAAEVGLALALLIGAGLLIRSFARVWAVEPGFDPHNVLTFGVELSSEVVSNPARTRAELQRLAERFASIPGVQTVGLAMGVLPMAGDAVVAFWPHGKPQPEKPDDWYRAQFFTVGADYFQALRIPMIRGRLFTQEDTLSAPAVAIVDQDVADRIFPGQDPLGQRIDLGPSPVPIQIVGVVGHVKHWGLDGDAKTPNPCEIYLPYAQVPDAALPESAHFTFAAIRSNVAPRSLIAAMRHETDMVDHGAAVYDVQTMEATVAGSLAQRRFSMTLLSIFAATALLLATIGVYGVVSYLVGLRTHEIGIRMALGAQRSDVLRVILSQNGMMVLAGIVFGIVASLGLTRLLGPMLFGVGALDPLTFALVAVTLLCVSLLACWVPARRAMRIDPMVALRHE